MESQVFLTHNNQQAAIHGIYLKSNLMLKASQKISASIGDTNMIMETRCSNITIHEKGIAERGQKIFLYAY